MAFDGYLLKVGAEIFPLSFVFKESYEVTPNRRQDLNSTRNANGILQRNVLSHKPSTISLSTRPMDNTELANMMSLITRNFVAENERKVQLTYYCPDINSYKTGYFYIPDITFPINLVDVENKTILYNSFTLEFIEY